MSIKDKHKETSEFIEWFNNLSDTQRKELSQIQLQQNQKEFEEFASKYDNGICYLCGSPLKKLKTEKPCLHWFIKPKGIKKRNFETLFKAFGNKYGFVRLNVYLRWVANIDRPIGGINDFDSSDKSRIIQETLKFKNLTWSFSCSKSDLAGHVDSKYGRYPHFHMEMRFDDKPIFRFNDFHIPFSDEDLFWLEMRYKNIEGMHLYSPPSFSFKQLAESMPDPKELLDSLEPATIEENASFNVQSVITPPDGDKISGDQLADAIEIAKRKNSTILKQLQNDKFFSHDIVTEISPGQGIPEIKTRSKRKKPKNSNLK